MKGLPLLVTTAIAYTLRPTQLSTQGHRRHRPATAPSSKADDADDASDDPSAALGDWRAFRAQLMETGVVTTEDAAPEAETKEARKPTAGPSARNSALVEAQSAKLFRELKIGSWAHDVANPEVGGLLLRMPLEMQLVSTPKSYWGSRLRRFAESDGAAPDDGSVLSEMLLYRVAQRFLKQQLQKVAEKAKPDANGQLTVDARLLTEQERELVEMHQRAVAAWQEVVLVLEHSPERSTSVVINRPVAQRAERELSTALVSALEVDTAAKLTADQFSLAFAPKFAAYAGTSPKRGISVKDVAIIHGVEGLDGATEIAPGIGIYRGGGAHAARNVISEANDSLEFRFFIGRQEWAAGDLDRAVAAGEYRPAACARALALKQCLGLPKPLWHEIMEMLGGVSLEVSRLELLKREDLDDAKAP
ncbi:hypothetical protein M885DRAFT_578381 [Pelagophyceae sp. CCMP2097]|nr:hypothetical protein M885DRAFT_578381 [Pelagophyceae sp. CCMP2097]